MDSKVVNLKFTKSALSLTAAFILAGTLMGCSTNVDAKESNVSSVVSQQASSSSNGSKKSDVYQIDDADSAVEKSIEIMIDGAERVAESTEKTKDTEAYIKAKEEAINNFITLVDFLEGDTEIAGYTVDQVEDSTIEYAKQSLDELDADLERIYPNYKEELKEKGIEIMDWLEEKGTDLAARGYDKYQELKQKTLEKTSK